MTDPIHHIIPINSFKTRLDFFRELYPGSGRELFGVKPDFTGSRSLYQADYLNAVNSGIEPPLNLVELPAISISQ